MIRVKVELDKFGLGTQIVPLAEVEISNDGTGSLGYGNYDVLCSSEGRQNAARVEDHPRLRESVLTLLRKALVASGY